MKLRTLLTALVTSALIAGLSGCSGKAASAPPPAVSAASSVATEPSTAASANPGALVSTASEETADRQAVEAAWTKFWGVYVRLHQIPAVQITATVNSVAVGVTHTQMLDEIKVFSAAHKTSYGYVVNHPYWQQPIGGKSTAVMGDCMDQSHYGSASTQTQAKLTVGVAHDNTQATLIQGADGVWRVQLIKYLLDIKC